MIPNIHKLREKTDYRYDISRQRELDKLRAEIVSFMELAAEVGRSETTYSPWRYPNGVVMELIRELQAEGYSTEYYSGTHSRLTISWRKL